GIIRLYTNNNGTYSTIPYANLAISAPPNSSFSSGFPILGDYDQDGDLDILYSGSAITQDLQITNFFGIYRNNGNGFSEAIIDNTSIGWNPSSVQWSDYDNDGDLDLVAYGVDAENNGIIRLYTNNNGTYSTIPYDEISILASEISVADNFTVSINDDVVVIEGELATFTVTLEGDNTQPVTVNYSTSNNTAIAGLDYEFTSGILTFNPGDKTKTITVQTLTDSLTESDETFFVNLSTTNANIEITDSQGIATIQDINYQNNPGILSFSNSEFRVNENGEAIVAVTVTRSGGSDGEVSATVTLSNGTATPVDGYDNTPITVTFAAGDTTSKIIQIPIVDDSIVESNESINLALTNPTGGATLGSQTTASLVIVDNDITLTSLTPDIYEFLAKDIGYKDWEINESISFYGYNYTVDSVIKNDTGLYGLGLISETFEPVLVLRGTEPTTNFLADIFADVNAEGIGFNQFLSARTEINQWLGKYDQPNIVGHSLGGALAQFFAADFTYENENKLLGDIFTFNAPGISQEWAIKFDPTEAGEVKHYIVSGDLVSLGGDDFIDGQYEIFRYTGFLDYVRSGTFNKHLNPILANEVNYDSTEQNTKLFKPLEIASQVFNSVDSLNSDYFTYAFSDIEFFNFLLGSFLLTDSFPETQELVSSLLFRITTENTRQQIGQQLIPIIDDLGITDDQDTGGSVKLPDINFKILNRLDVEATDLGAIYVEQPDKFLKLQGIVSIPTIYNVTGNFANDNFIKLAYDADNNLVVDLVGSISVENISIVENVWEVKTASLYFDTISNEIKGDGLVLIPTGIAIGGGIGFINGEFNYLSLAVDELNRPIGTTGAFLQGINGQIDNIAPSDADPIEFTGGLGLTAGPEINVSVPSWLAGATNFSGSLLELDLTGSLNTNQIQGNGSVKLLGGLATGQGDATLKLNEKLLDANINLSIGDIINGQGELNATSNFDFGLSFGATVKAPNVNLEFEADTLLFGKVKKEINFGGQELISANAVIEFTNDNNLSNDFIRSSGKIDVPIIGNQEVAFKVFLDGTVEANLGSFLVEINSFQVDTSTSWVIFNANWDTASENVQVQIIKPDGTILQESDFANSSDIAIIETLSGSTTRAVVVANPEAGIWDINVVDGTGLGDVQYSAFRDSERPVLEINSISSNADASEITINYTATDPDSEAQISLFYDDDATGNDGIFIASGLQELDGADTFTWNSQGVAPGTYYVYAMALDDNHAPVFAYSPTSVEITAQADLVITKTASADSVQIGDSLTYTITITNNGTIESQGINLTETLGDGVTFVSASLTPTNQSEGTLNFDLGNLASSATTTVEITVTAPSTTGVISSRSQIFSDTFDPNANNDFVILDTTVVEKVIANNTPVATDDIATTQEDTAVVINVLNNDSDLDNNLDVTTVEVATNPNNGTVNVNSTTGEITYTPTTNFSGNDSFTYTVKDSSGVTSNPATVNIIVNSVASEVANFNNSNNSQVFNVGGKPEQTRQLQLSFVSQNTNSINEIGVFIADDDQGTINGITPDNPNYLTTALTNSQVIFSALANNVLPGVNFTRQLNFAGSDNLIFYLVQNSTTETVLADLTAGKTPANVLFAIPSANSNGFDPLQVSDLNNEAFTLSWKDTLNSSDNVFNDLVLNVQVANETSTPPGTGLQGRVELIDLRNLGTLEASFKVASEAAYNNTVGWYLVDDETGLIGNLKPGDAGYAEAAIAQRSVTHFTRDGIDSAQLQGLLAPYLIANSSRESFLANNPNNTLGNGSLAYFAFMGANPDGVDHVRQLGDNTFGFEDLFNGGDKDYNDMIVQINFS
uniref:Calx-beta domain-containing protein n=1 Tax=Nodularia chucula TaxID=3093667 RepID=UPI0039C683D1